MSTSSAQSRPPPSSSIPPGPNQRLSVESATSQASSLFSGRDGRKSTSSGRPSKGMFESVLGFDPTGGSEKPGRQPSAANVVAGQDQLEGMDEFEALLKGGSTKKMSLTPVVMKRTEVRVARLRPLLGCRVRRG